MTVRVGINGFGRIGRLVYRAAMSHPDVEIVAINDLGSPESMAHLLKYDSVHRPLSEKVGLDADVLTVGGRRVQLLSDRDPAALPWGSLGVDVVIEATGFFTSREGATKHLEAGAKKVIISAPAQDPDITIVLGVNEGLYDQASHHIISNASCTTNCLGPIAKILLDSFGLEWGYMTTCHAYTNDQRILDLFHKDPRRARSAALSIIPTSTGAARAIGLVIPELKGKLDGISLRVPVPDGSVVDLVAQLGREVTRDELNAAIKKAADGPMKHVLQYTEDPIVSADVIGSPYSSVFDSLSTMIMGKVVKVLSWYDNEWGYSNRVVDLIEYVTSSKSVG